MHACQFADEFHVITGRIRLFSTFGAIANIALADREPAAAQTAKLPSRQNPVTTRPFGQVGLREESD